MNTIKQEPNYNNKINKIKGNNKIVRKGKNTNNYTPKMNIRNVNRFENENIKNHPIEEKFNKFK